MDAEKAKLISLLTNAKIRAVGYDLEITLDDLKNSGWSAALAGAGLGLSLTKWQIYEFEGSHAALFFALAHAAVSAPLLVSVALGAFLNWNINKQCSLKRHYMTFLLKQEVILFADDDVDEDGRDLGNKIFSGGYLNLNDREEFSSLSKQDKKLESREKWIALQQSLLVLGYLAAVILAAIYQLGHPHG